MCELINFLFESLGVVFTLRDWPKHIKPDKTKQNKTFLYNLKVSNLPYIFMKTLLFEDIILYNPNWMTFILVRTYGREMCGFQLSCAPLRAFWPCSFWPSFRRAQTRQNYPFLPAQEISSRAMRAYTFCCSSDPAAAPATNTGKWPYGNVTKQHVLLQAHEVSQFVAAVQ